MRKAIYITALTGLIAAASVQASYAQGGGGGGGGGGSASSGGGSTGGASSGGSVGSPSTGSAGAGSLGVSGVGNAPNFNQGTTTGLANRPANSPQPNPADGDQRNLASPQRGTNSVGTANSSGVGGSGRSSGPTRTKEGASDAQIDAENRKADQKVRSICKGC
jgi:hypothetical protein